MNDAMSADAIPTSKVICNIPTFCHIYLSTYSQVFPTNAPFYAGREAGEKFADHVLSICHEPGRLQIPPGHSNSWQTGYSEGYGDWISDAANDDGTYGANKCHFG